MNRRDFLKASAGAVAAVAAAPLLAAIPKLDLLASGGAVDGSLLSGSVTFSIAGFEPYIRVGDIISIGGRPREFFRVVSAAISCSLDEAVRYDLECRPYREEVCSEPIPYESRSSEQDRHLMFNPSSPPFRAKVPTLERLPSS